MTHSAGSFAAELPAIAALTEDTGESFVVPASYAQEQLWAVHQAEKDSGLYNVSVVIRFELPLNVEALRLSFEAIVRRHEVRSFAG